MDAALCEGWGHLEGSHLKSGKMPGRGGFVFGKELRVQGNQLQVDSKAISNAAGMDSHQDQKLFLCIWKKKIR